MRNRLSMEGRNPMKQKILIVEDDAMIAGDLQYEVERLGYEVVGIGESAEEAMSIAEIYRPQLALMDINILGCLDGIQTARLLQDLYRIPVIFLTSCNDEETIRRAAAEAPYGYLIKPASRSDLNAVTQLAFLRIEQETKSRSADSQAKGTGEAIHEGILTVSLDGRVQFMNAAAERLTGMLPSAVRGRQLGEVLRLRHDLDKTVRGLHNARHYVRVQEMGWVPKNGGGGETLVHISLSSLVSASGDGTGYLLMLHAAVEQVHLHSATLTPNTASKCDPSSVALATLDERGNFLGASSSFLRELDLQLSHLAGRSLTELSLDPDPRISDQLVPRLLGLPYAGSSRR
jgi:PAS domain S-box-containing protein